MVVEAKLVEIIKYTEIESLLKKRKGNQSVLKRSFEEIFGLHEEKNLLSRRKSKRLENLKRNADKSDSTNQ